MTHTHTHTQLEEDGDDEEEEKRKAQLSSPRHMCSSAIYVTQYVVHQEY